MTKKQAGIFVLSLILLTLVSACFWSKPIPPAKPTATLGQTAPLVDADAAVAAAVKRSEEANVALQAKNQARAAEVKANVTAAREENKSNPDGPPKVIVDGELGLAQAKLADVQEDPVEAVAAAQRKALVEAGKAEEARKAYERGNIAAMQLVGDLATLQEQKAQSDRDRDFAQAQLKKATADHLAKLEENRIANQTVLNNQKSYYEGELDKERKAFMRSMGKWLIGAGVVLILIGAFIAYTGVQAGNLIGSLTKAGVFAGAAAFCFACAWTINQWWFKWVVIVGGSLSVLGIAGYLWSEWRENKERKTLDKDATEAEATLTKLSELIHLKETPNEDPIFGQMSSTLDDNQKALILELRAIAKRKKAA